MNDESYGKVIIMNMNETLRSGLVKILLSECGINNWVTTELEWGKMKLWLESRDYW